MFNFKTARLGLFLTPRICVQLVNKYIRYVYRFNLKTNIAITKQFTVQSVIQVEGGGGASGE